MTIGDRWDWSKFKGSPAALKYNRRDVGSIAKVLPRCLGRVAAIQAGGNLGIWPKALAAEFSTVYTFEPDPETFAKLCHNAPERNILKYQAALGAVRGTVAISGERRKGTGPAHEGLGHVDLSRPGDVPTLRADDLGLRRCDLIWLDVEGFELFALVGAELTLARSRPVVVIEVNEQLKFYTESDQVELWLDQHGYEQVDAFGSDRVYMAHK